MKATLLLLIFLLVSSVYAKRYGMAGCGLGSQVFGSDQAISTQVLAATTNGSSMNQSFGITTGTSNCEESKNKMAINEFINHNKIALSSDIARGNGPELTTLLDLMNCRTNSKIAPYLQMNHQNIFKSYNSKKIADRIITMIQTNDHLKQNCNIQA